MKKSIILFAMLLVSIGASAQAWSEQVQFGARGGVNFSTVTGDDYDSPDSRTSFYAGLLAELPVTERFSFQPEVFYSGQGYDLTDEPNQRDAEFQMDYIQVPVLAKIYLIEGLNIHLGPQFGFKVNEEIDFEPGENSGDLDSDSIKDFDFQVTGGLEYKIASNIFIQGRYSYGFSEVVEDLDVHTSVFSAGIGFMF